MKTTLALLLLFTASALFAQSAGVATRSAQPAVAQFESHPQRARQHVMAQEENILFNASNPSAQGERPLWEVAQPAPEIPLGDIARMLRDEHMTARKAVKSLEK